MTAHSCGMASLSIILCLCLSGKYVACASEKTFIAHPPTIFNHLAIDISTNSLYIGAENGIYQLSENLELINTITIGPVNKSMVNKVLLIDQESNRLISCGSEHGFCSTRDLHNISNVLYEGHEVVVPTTKEGSAVAFIAPGPTAKVMYVGATSTTTSPYDDIIPTVSSRSLEDHRLFTVPNTGEAIGPKLYVSSLSRDRYPINYVYGFSSEGFSYFLTTQLKNVGSDTYYSKLVRVCHGDENYYSYTEIPISCHKEGYFNFNLVQAAFVGKAGSTLAGHLGISTLDDVLYAVFSPSLTKNTSTPFDASVLCVYTLKDIRRKFTQNIQNCFQGNGLRGLDFNTPLAPCIPAKFYPITEDFCGLDVNTPLGGEQPVEASPVLLLTERLTAVAATVTQNTTVLFAGTSQGHLKKIVVENSTSAYEYNDVIVDKGSPINKDLLFDSQQRYLYAMSETKVSKVKIV